MATRGEHIAAEFSSDKRHLTDAECRRLAAMIDGVLATPFLPEQQTLYPEDPMPEGATNDPALYRRLCEPFPSVKEANDAIHAFCTDLRALREKHKLPDVYCIISGFMIYEDGSETQFMTSSHDGDMLKGESMTAWAFGREQGERQEFVAKAMSHRPVIRKPPRGK